MTRDTVSNFIKNTGFAAIAACFAATTSTFASDMVTIEFGPDDELTGYLLTTTEGNIRLATEFMGIVTIPVSGATCIGAACPDDLKPVTDETPQEVASVGKTFTQQTLSELSQKSRLVSCQGQGCPPNIPLFDVANKVTLKNGDVVLEGVLTGLEPDAYIVSTKDLGVVRVAASFECIGTTCPSR